MRRRLSWIIPAVSTLLTSLPGVAAGDADLPDRERIHHSYELANGASVEVLGITGRGA
jgi:hypothetical protein